MRAELVLTLVRAHRRGKETEFETAVRELAEGEARRGNTGVAAQLLNELSHGPASPSASYEASNIAPLERMVPLGQPAARPSGQPAAPQASPPPTAIDGNGAFWVLEHPSERLADVAAPAATIERVQLIAGELRLDNALADWGIDQALRVLFYGPPGNGKTLAARAIAGEARRPILILHLDLVLSSYLGETGRNLRAAFDEAIRTNAVLFLDEVDALAKERADPHEIGEMKRVVNALLQNIDRTRSVLPIIAATNHESVLDKAIWRRFTDLVQFSPPNAEARSRIAAFQLKRVPHERDVTPAKIAAETDGFSGSDVVVLIRNAVRRAIQARHAKVSVPDVQASLADMMASRAPNAPPPGGRSDQLRRIIELRAQGLNQRDIGRELGISAATVNRRLKTVEQPEA